MEGGGDSRRASVEEVVVGFGRQEALKERFASAAYWID